MYLKILFRLRLKDKKFKFSYVQIFISPHYRSDHWPSG